MTNPSKVVVFVRDNKFHITFPYNPALISVVKQTIPDVWFSRANTCWVAPLRSYPELMVFVEAHHATMDWGKTDPKAVALKFSTYSGGLPRPTISPRKGKNANLLAITFPYHPDLTAATAALPCAFKSKTKANGQHWAVPMSDAEAIVAYSGVYNARLDEELAELLETTSAAQSVNRALSWQVEPEGGGEYYRSAERSPYKYQQAAVDYMLKNKNVILGEAMGVGKTSCAISALGTADAFPALVVVPKSAKFVWDEYELPLWMPDRSRQVLSGQTPNQELHADIVIINYDILWFWREALAAYGFKTFIADESHALANPTAKRTIAAEYICKSDSVLYRWLMTGTAVTNRPTEVIGQLGVLGTLGSLFVNASTFKARYEAERGVVSNLTELGSIIRGNCFMRRNKDDLHAPIPVVRSYLPIETTAEDLKEYRAAERDIISYLTEKARLIAEELGEDQESAAVRAKVRATAGKDIVRLSQLRQLAGKAKFAGTVEFITDYMAQYPEEKILLFGHHRESLKAYRDHFDCKIIQGGVSDADRAAAIRGIQEGDDRIVCLQIRAAGEALTLTAAATCIFTEQDWSPMRMLQAEARSARLGQKSNVMVYYTVAEGTIDYKLFSTLQAKYETCLRIMDDPDSDELTFIANKTEADLLEALMNRT